MAAKFTSTIYEHEHSAFLIVVMDSASSASAVQLEMELVEVNSALGKGTNKGERVTGHEPIITQHVVANLLASYIYTMATLLSFQYGRGHGKQCGGAGE